MRDIEEPAPLQQATIVEVEPTPVSGPGQQGLVAHPTVEPETRPLLRRQCTFCLLVLSDYDPARLRLHRTFALVRHSYFCYFYRNGVTTPANLNICLSGHYADSMICPRPS